jgi:dihydrolipoamide dehydrogenase
MVVGEMPQAVDLVVIGAGPGGYTAALAAAKAGRRVHLVESAGAAGIGGVCLLEGCIPSKALIELGEAVHSAGRREAMGLPGTTARPDLALFQSWKRDVITTLGDGVRARLRAADVTMVAGRAAFTGPRSMRIEHDDGPSETWEFRSAVIAAGSAPATIPRLGGDPRVTDAAGVLALDHLPERIVVIGAGYVGIELGTALAKLGATVTIVEARDSILEMVGDRAAGEVARGLRRLGVTVMTATVVQGIDEAGIEVVTAGATERLEADLVLVATGRVPNSAELGLAAARIATTESGHIVVDSALIAAPGIAAIGDIVAGPGLAHRAMAQAGVAVSALSGEKVAWDSLVPSVVFSDPEVATVGLGLVDAIELGYDAAESVLPYAYSGKAHILQATDGHHAVVFERATGLLLGATVTGANATELISEFTVAIEGGLLLEDVVRSVHPHPTLSELALHDTPSHPIVQTEEIPAR